MQFIAELAPGSHAIQDLNEKFRHIAPSLDIYSFYETRPTPLAFNTSKLVRSSCVSSSYGAVLISYPFPQMVLERDSSVLGYPGEIARSLDADHHGVCKYTSPSDPRYISVRNVLKAVVGKISLSGMSDFLITHNEASSASLGCGH
jgi:hypothetical protein